MCAVKHKQVSWETETLVEGTPKVWQRFCPKAALPHVGLLIALMLYTAGGGLVFRALEYPAEMAKLEYHNAAVKSNRTYLLSYIRNNSDSYDLEYLVSVKLGEYELAIEAAVHNGVVLTELDSPIEAKWSTLRAVFFSSTVLTTIGYGNIVPVTFWGRVFCIAYALVGIPLTLTVIADMGRMFASAVSMLARHMPEMPRWWRTASSNTTSRTSLYALAAVGFLFLYLAAGAAIFTIWEDWSFGDGFYFCFVTMTTIGFGDLVPRDPKYMLICTIYILIGLALTSTIIELVRRQYARSWQRLRALSGPLADSLRRLGDSRGLGMDVAALTDLRKVLTVVSMPRLSQGRDGSDDDKRQLEWEAAVEAVIRDITAPKPKPPLVQIVIYESSV